MKPPRVSGHTQIRCAILAFLVAIAFGGCTSHRDVRAQGEGLLGGGYIEQELREGLYFIEVKTNFAPLPNQAGARKMFQQRAKALCGDSGYKILHSKIDVYESFQGIKGYKISKMSGYILSHDSPLTEDQAMNLINTDYDPARAIQSVMPGRT